MPWRGRERYEGARCRVDIAEGARAARLDFSADTVRKWVTPTIARHVRAGRALRFREARTYRVARGSGDVRNHNARSVVCAVSRGRSSVQDPKDIERSRPSTRVRTKPGRSASSIRCDDSKMEVTKGLVTRDASPRMALRTVAERWLEAQQADGERDADREFVGFRSHVTRLIGSKRIGDIEARDVLLMIRDAEAPEESEWIPASCRWVHREHPRCLFERVRARDPRRCDRGSIRSSRSRAEGAPKSEAKGGIPYRHHEAVALMTDPRIRRGPEGLEHVASVDRHADRRNVWTPLARLRPGNAGARGHPRLEPVRGPAAQDGPRASHEKERFVPVHPVLAKALAEWRLGGFAEVYGRPPNGGRLHRAGPRNDGRENAEQSRQESPARTPSCSASTFPADLPTAYAAGSSRRAATPRHVRRWSSS